MTITTASVFDQAIDPPETGKGSELLELLDNSIDSVFWLSNAYANLYLGELVASRFNTEFRDKNRLYLRYDNYSDVFDNNYLNHAANANVLLNKKSKLKFRIYNGSPYQLPDLDFSEPAKDSLGFSISSIHNGLKELVKTKSLEETLIIKPDWNNFLNNAPQEFLDELNEFEDIKDLTKNLRNFVSEIRLNFSNLASLSDPDRTFYLSEIEYTIDVLFDIQDDVIEYLTQGEDRNTEKVIALKTYGVNLIRAWFDKNYTAYAPVQSLASVVNNTKDIIKPIKSSNDEDFAIMLDGRLRWVPNVDDLKTYNKHNKKAVKEDKDGNLTFDPYEIDPETNEKRLSSSGKNQVFYTDWGFGIITYQNLEGHLSTIDIVGSRPAKLSHFNALIGTDSNTTTLLNRLITNIEGFLRKKLGFENFFEHYVKFEHLEQILLPIDKGRLEQSGVHTVQDLADFIDSSVSSRLREATSYITGLSSLMQSLYRRYRLLGGGLQEDFENTDAYSAYSSMWSVEKLLQFSAIYEPIINMIKDLSKEDYEEFMKYVGVSGCMEQLPLHYLISNYTIESIKEEVAKEQQKLGLLEAVPDDYTPEPLHNIRDGMSFLPHQIRANYRLNKENGNVVESIAAGGGKCLTGNALVPTSQGLLSLKEIYDSGIGKGKEKLLQGVQVLTKEGIKSASGTYRNKGKTYKVVLSNGSTIEGLPEHRLWVLRDNKEQFVRLDELTYSDYLPRYAKTGLFGSNTDLNDIFIGCSTYAGTCFDKNNLRLPKILTPDVAELLGWVVSEGCGTLGNSISQHSEEMLDRIERLGKRVFGKNSVTREDNLIKWRSIIIKDWFNEVTGAVYSNKRYIPRIIRQAPKPIVAAFLRSLFEGDGSVYPTNGGTTENPRFGGYTLEYCTISKKLANELLVLLENFGLMCCLTWGPIYQSQNGNARKYTLSINRSSWISFQKEIGFLSERKRSILQEAINWRAEVAGTTNDTCRGVENLYPCGDLLQECYFELEKYIENSGYQYITTFTRGDKEIQQHNKFALRNLHVLAKTNGQEYSTRITKGAVIYGFNKNNLTNSLSLETLFKCLDYLPVEIRDTIPDMYWDKIEVLKGMYSKSWLSIRHLSKGKKEKRVYDICVPGPHEYSVQTIMSHNTIMAITDALRHQAKGRRVAVVCPNYLMRNYIEDTAYVTQGKMNVVPIDIGVYNTYGEQKLHSMITTAPPNTLFVIGLNLFSQGKNVKFNYNGQEITVNQVVEFLRSFKWDVVILDESHMLANANSNRSTSMVRFLSDIPYRRELTGTYINNNCMDAFGQMKYLDPGVLGHIDTFIENYAGAMRGDKVIAWRSGAERDISNKISANVDYINILRKEWAALLPDREEEFHLVNLSPAQSKVYNAILTEVLDEIKKDPDMMRLIAEAEANGDDASSSALEAKLRAYLARIERFLAACDLDPVGSELLSDADLVSPKSEKINEILDNHFNNPDSKKGKVLIFTSFRNSAESIYNNLDPKWKKYALHYVAERKDELIPLMKKDKNVKIVIGVEQSLNTGHNFQMFTRLIRVESVWNPGTLDQAESRLNRPDPKNKNEARTKIFYDWILCNNTIDITKCSRLISKVLSAARFNNHDPRYSQLPDLPVVGMTLSNIQQNNDYNGSLAHYAKAYSQYLTIQREEFHEFRETTSHKVPVEIPNAGIMTGSKIINTPYIPGQVLPFQEDLGIQSIEDLALEHGTSVANLDNDLLIDKRAHTAFGDGIITGVYTGSIKVRLDEGGTVSVNKLTAFIIPDNQKKPTKQLINEMIGLKAVKDKSPKVEVKPEPEVEQPKEKKKERNRTVIEPQNNLTKDNLVEGYIGSMNNAIAVFLSSEDEDLTVDSVADDLELHHSGSYYYCHCRRYQHLAEMLDLLEEKFEIPLSQLNRLYDWLEIFESGRSKLFNLERAERMEMKNFYLRKKKRVPLGQLHVFPTVEDGQFFLIAFGDNQQSDAKLPRLKVRGAKWERDETGFYFKTFHRKGEVKDFITKDLKRVGLKLSNLEEFKEDYKQLKIKK